MLKDSPLQDPAEKDLPTLEELQAQLDLVVSENPNEFTEREPMTLSELRAAYDSVFQNAADMGVELEPIQWGTEDERSSAASERTWKQGVGQALRSIPEMPGALYNAVGDAQNSFGRWLLGGLHDMGEEAREARRASGQITEEEYQQQQADASRSMEDIHSRIDARTGPLGDGIYGKLGLGVKAQDAAKAVTAFIDDKLTLSEEALAYSDRTFWGTDVPGAIASTVPAIGATLLGGPAAGAAVFAGQGSTQMYNDASSMGGSEGQRIAAYLSGGAIGLTEALPIGRFIGRVSKMGGKKTLGKALGVVLASSLEEGIQEGVIQTPLEQIFSQHIIQYADKQSLGENFRDAAHAGLLGMTVGGLLSSAGVTVKVASDSRDPRAANRVLEGNEGDEATALFSEIDTRARAGEVTAETKRLMREAYRRATPEQIEDRLERIAHREAAAAEMGATNYAAQITAEFQEAAGILLENARANPDGLSEFHELSPVKADPAKAAEGRATLGSAIGEDSSEVQDGSEAPVQDSPEVVDAEAKARSRTAETRMLDRFAEEATQAAAESGLDEDKASARDWVELADEARKVSDEADEAYRLLRDEQAKAETEPSEGAVTPPVLEEALTPEQAAEALKQKNNVLDAEVRVLSAESTAQEQDEDEPISRGEREVRDYLALLREVREDPSTVPDIALVDAGSPLTFDGVAAGGAIALDVNRVGDALRGTVMHELQHNSAPRGSEAFNRTVALAQQHFPALFQAKVDRYVADRTAENDGVNPFEGMPPGSETDAFLADEGFAKGAGDFHSLVDFTLRNPALVAAMSVTEARTLRDYVVAVLNKIPGFNLQTTAGKERRALVDRLVAMELQEGASPEEIMAFASAIADVMRSPTPAEFRKASEIVTVAEIVAPESSSQEDLDNALASSVDVAEVEAEVVGEQSGEQIKGSVPKADEKPAVGAEKPDSSGEQMPGSKSPLTPAQERRAKKRRARDRKKADALRAEGREAEAVAIEKKASKPTRPAQTRSSRGLSAREAAMEAGDVDEFMYSIAESAGAVSFTKGKGPKVEIKKVKLKWGVYLEDVLYSTHPNLKVAGIRAAYLASGAEPDVLLDDELQALIDKAGHELGVDRGERKTVKPSGVKVTAEEMEVIQMAHERYPSLSLRELKRYVREARSQFPTSDGWILPHVEGVKSPPKPKKPKKGEKAVKVEPWVPTPATALQWGTVRYTFHHDPKTGRNTVATEIHRQKVMARRVEREVRRWARRAKAGDPAALVAMRQSAWYSNVVTRLRNEFGSQSDIFVDLLGALSPNTDVRGNFAYAVQALQKFSRGDYDAILDEYQSFLDAGGKKSDYEGPLVLRPSKGGEMKKYGMNSKHAMDAMLVARWRLVSPGSAPKAKNFSWNLGGYSVDATVDIWAARFLQRMANLKRVATLSEAGLGGNWNTSGTAVTGEFGFGQEVLQRAAEALGMDASDLQALVWFIEKAHWTKNNWTTQDGEGGSFEDQLDKHMFSHRTAGVSSERPGRPQSQGRAEPFQSVLDGLAADNDVVAYMGLSTQGVFLGEKEVSFDHELTTRRGWQNEQDWTDALIEFAAENEQDAVFTTRTLRVGEVFDGPVAPGLTVTFTEAIDPLEAGDLIDMAQEAGFVGQTFTRDPRRSKPLSLEERFAEPTTFTGFRLFFFPEWSDGTLTSEQAVDKLQDLAEELQQSGLVEAAEETYSEYNLFERGEHYEDRRTKAERQRNDAAEAGGVEGSASQAESEQLDADATGQADPSREGPGDIGVRDVRGRDQEGQSVRFSVAPATDSAAFKKWFKQSAVVDAGGKPQRVYHGTSRSFSAFSDAERGSATGKGGARMGHFFTSDATIAGGFAYNSANKRAAHGDGHGARTVPVYLSLQDPMIVMGEMRPTHTEMESHIREAESLGHDGVIFRGIQDSTATSLSSVTLDGGVVNLDPRGSFGADTLDGYASGEVSGKEISEELRDAATFYKQEIEDEDHASRPADEREEAETESEMWTELAEAWDDDPTRFDVHQEDISDIFVAFSPTQIKSATGNRGTFDENNPDIRFSIAPQSQLGFYSNTEEALEKMVGKSGAKKIKKDLLVSRLLAAGGNKEEAAWMGLEEWAKAHPEPRIPVEEVREFLRENGIVVGEKVLGGAADEDVLRKQWVDGVLESLYLSEEVEDHGGFVAYDENGELLHTYQGDLMVGESRGELTETLREYYEQVAESMYEQDLRAGLDPSMSEGEGPPKHGDYQLPGGENYRELLLTLPKREAEIPGFQDYTKGHYGDTPNVLAHIRFNERTGPNGEKVLFIEEIQSDWHQAGREGGYASPNAGRGTEGETVFSEDGGGHHEWVLDSIGREVREEFVHLTGLVEAMEHTEAEGARYHEIIAEHNPTDLIRGARVPDAPFKTSWEKLAMRRAIRWAAENGFDQVAWTTGVQQVERYETSLRKVVDDHKWRSTDDGGRRVIFYKNEENVLEFETDAEGVINGDWINAHDLLGKNMAEVIGKGAAQRILAEPKGDDAGPLTIGGEGMKAAYDRRLVGIANKLGKTFGAEVGKVDIDAPTVLPRKMVPASYVQYPDGINVLDQDGSFLWTAESVQEAEGWIAQYADEVAKWTPQTAPVHSLPITEKMKGSVMQGQPMFSIAPEGRKIQTSDGWMWHEQPDGSWADSPDAADADMNTGKRTALSLMEEFDGVLVGVASHEMTADEYVANAKSHFNRGRDSELFKIWAMPERMPTVQEQQLIQMYGWVPEWFNEKQPEDRAREALPKMGKDFEIKAREMHAQAVDFHESMGGERFSVAPKGRVPKLTEAAQKMAAGGTPTREQFRSLVDEYKPVRPYDHVPEPASNADMKRALGKKADKIGAGDAVAEGTRVGLRLDIPAYTRHGVWVPTIHVGKGAAKVIGYGSVASVTNAEFRMSEKAALKIAAGKSKDPFAMIRGDWLPRTPAETKALAEEALNDPSWIQVGMDPERHGYFYDRKTHELVEGADEVIQVGPLVLAKNPKMGDTSSARFSIAPEGRVDTVIHMNGEGAAFDKLVLDTKAKFPDADIRVNTGEPSTDLDAITPSEDSGEEGEWLTTDELQQNIEDSFFAVRKRARELSKDERLYYSDFSKAQMRSKGRVQHESKLVVDALVSEYVKITGDRITLDEASLFIEMAGSEERNETAYQRDLKEMSEKARPYQIWQAVKGGKPKHIASYTDEAARNAALKARRKADPAAGDFAKEARDGWGHEVKPASGVPTSEARAFLREKLTGPDGKMYRKLRNWNRRVQREILDAKLRDGLISQELYDAIIGMGWKDYSSFRHAMKGKRSFSRAGGYGTKAMLGKRFRGRSSRPDNVIKNMIMDATKGLQDRHAAIVGREFLRMAEENPDPDVWTVVEGSLSSVKMATKAEIEEDSASNSGMVMREAWDARIERPDLAVPVMRDGKQFWVVMNPKHKRMAEAMNGPPGRAMGTFARRVVMITRLMGSLWTSRSVTFMLASNAPRDTTMGLTMLELDHGAAASAGVLRRQPAALMGFRDYQKGKKTAWSRRAERFLELGGQAGWFFGGDMDSIQAAIEGELKSKEYGKTRKAITEAFEFLEDWNEAVENGIRLATFSYLVEEAGMPEVEAIIYAKEMTVNFDMRGKWIRSIAPYYLFVSAGISGNRRIRQAALGESIANRELAGKMGKTFARRAVKRAAAGVVLAAIYDIMMWMTAGDDDDGNNAWDSEAEYRKDRNFYVPNPGGNPIPLWKLPYGLNVIPTFGRKIAEVVTGRTSVGKASAQMVDSLMGSFSPLGSVSISEGGDPLADVARIIAPSILDIPVDILSNTRFTGSKIAPEPRAGDRTPGPAWQRAYSNTPDRYVALSKVLADIGGGTETRPSGPITEAFTPEGMRHAVDSFFGGTGKDVAGVWDGFMALMEGQLGDAGRAFPIIRAMMPADADKKTAWFTRRATTEIDYTLEDLKQRQEDGDEDEIAKFEVENRAVLDMESDLKELDKKLKANWRKMKTAKGEARRILEEDTLSLSRAFNKKARAAFDARGDK